MSKNISIVGLGKLGACMVATYASKGHHVIGVDINQNFVDTINQGKTPVDEKDLNEYISRNKDRLKATTNYHEAVEHTDITFIIVPTPTDETGGFSATFVKNACQDIGKSLRNKDTYHLVVLTSTLLPGDCEEKIIPVLEEFSGKICGQDFGFCYSPEFIAIGSVIHDLLNPDFFLIGEFDTKSGNTLEDFYRETSDNHAPCKRMSISSAELTKISVNSFLTMKITYANMLTELAENIAGVDVDNVTDAIGSDKRIGKLYLKGGLGFGGPCFPRDNRAFAFMANLRGVEAPFAAKVDLYNKSIIDRSIRIIKKYADDLSIGILGLSYKPGTYFAEESQSLEIAKILSAQEYVVNVFEPCGYVHASTLLKDAVVYCDSLDDCVKNSKVLFLGNLDNSYDRLVELADGNIIVDPWRQFRDKKFKENVKYIPFGIGI